MSVAVGQESLVHQAWNLLMDESARSIAIFGPGGIGKTTLMKQLYSKSIATNHFQAVIWITVSSKLTFQKVQDDISKSLGLFDPDWVWKTSEEKSQLIRTEIITRKSVLFLDDLWFYIDLKGLGVEGSKFVFSTRNAAVPKRMGAYTVLKLEELSGENAWQLFQSKIIDHEKFKDLRIAEMARKLVSKCDGLPILISTLGAAMSSKMTLKEWESAVQKIENLRQGRTNDEVTSIFKFCFDSLPNANVRSCLSYFSLFPEDFTILKKDLIDFWICENIVGDYSTRDEALSLRYDAMHTLVRTGFLEEEGNENNCVKLLDMIRKFAISSVTKFPVLHSAELLTVVKYKPTSTEYNVIQYFGLFLTIMVKFLTGGPLFKEQRHEETVSVIETIGWMSSFGKYSRSILADVPTDLFTFLLSHNPFVMIKRKPSSHIYNLTVLDLSYSGIVVVPLEFSTLVSLQYLNLSHTWIDRLPVKLKMLTKLWCLNLEYNVQLRVIPMELISGLSSLQILKLFRCGFSVEEEASNMLYVKNMDINPLLSLEHLKVLSITITCVSALCTFISNFTLLDITESLSLEVFWGLESLDLTPLAAIKNLLTFEIHQAERLKEFSLHHPDLLKMGSFRRLQEVKFEQCSSLKELTWVVLVPNLTILRVKSCEKIQKIISGEWLNKIRAEENLKVFEKLEVLSIDSLAELSSIYETSLPFQCLKKMEIVDCLLLKKLPLNLNMTKADEVVIEAEEDWWEEVQWENEADKATFLCRFKPLM